LFTVASTPDEKAVAVMTNDCSNPQTRRVSNYRETQKEWRKRPEYKEKSEAFLKKYPWCEIWLAAGVKVPASEIHHPNRWSYQHGFEVYVDFENNGAMAVSGRNGGGHYAAHNNLKVCPICKKKKCNIYAEGCQSCLERKHPGLAARLKTSREEKRLARLALQKKLRKDAAEKAKAWKKAHPMGVKK
jgi:hypothetical protein